MASPESRVRVHLWRVHASSFLALVATQTLLACYLYMFQPDVTPTRIHRYMQRHQDNLHGTQVQVSPHTIWTRMDLLLNDPSRARKADVGVVKETRKLQLDIARTQFSTETRHLKSKAESLFETLKVGKS